MLLINMGKSCSIRNHVRNSQGELVESRLFNDLLSYLPSRDSAKEYYGVGTNQEFLSKVRDKARFDENGEITFNSLRKLAKIDLSEEKIIANLNKEIGAGVLNYQEAVTKAKNFNANSQYNDDFMATLTYNEGKYDLHIVKKDASKLAELQKVIEKQEIVNKLINKLESYGVDTKFITDGNSRYSTVNAERLANGLYSLIQVSHGDNIDVELAEEAGHFAVGALGRNPLVDRLTNLLNEDVQRQILGDNYYAKDLGDNPRREIAGMLVGEALHKQLEPKTPWQRLAGRIADLAKSIFTRFTGNEVKTAMVEAQKIARDIAGGFLSDNFKGNVSNALEYRETLNSARLSYNVQTFKRVVETLGSMAKELEAVSSDKLSSDITAFLGQAVGGRDNILTSPFVDADLLSFQGLCQVLVDISDLLGPGKEIDNLINSVDFSNPTNFYESMAEHGNNLRKARVFTRNAIIIASILRNAVTNHDNKLVLPAGQTLGDAYFSDMVGRLTHIDFRKMLDELENALKVVDSQLSSNENAYFLRFCEDIYGGKYINTSAQIVWNQKRLTRQEADKIPIEDLLTNLESDIDIFHRYIGSMSNNPDIIGQIVDKAVKAANKRADDEVIKYQERLRELQDKLKNDYGLTNTDWMYEKDSEGNYTGNFITAPNHDILDENDKEVAVNYGEWEKARREFRKQFEEDFKKRYKDWESWSGFKRGMLFDEEFRKAYKDWNDKNSKLITKKDDAGNIISAEWHPNAKYKSNQFNELITKYPGIQKWLAEMMEIKRELDSMLVPGATYSWRAPQFKGTFSNRLANKRNIMSRGKAAYTTVRESIFETFCESSEDTDYGDNTTLNNPYENLLGTPMDYEKEKPNRVPMFGINKLDDMTQLSTDIFHSMLSYAAMANSYQAMSSVVDAVEVGRNSLENRNILGKGGKREKDLENHSRAYTRYTKFLDKQVYGISATHWGIQIGKHKWLLNKMIQALTKWASFRFLGGNILGGTVNTGTGAIEVFKEAASSNEFSFNDLKWAHLYYWRSLPSNWRHATSLQKDDKMSLFIRHFNIRGDNKEKFRSRYNKKSILRRAFESSIYLPYSSGDHYMQSMAYLAIAHNIQLVGTKGTRTNLWNAYERKELSRKTDPSLKDKALGNVKSYTLEFKGKLFDSATGPNGITSDKLRDNEIFLKSDTNRDEYNMLEDLLGRVEKAIFSPLIGLTLTAEQQDYLNKNNIGLGDLYKIKTSVQNAIYKMIWTLDDETKYMDKAREINNRMHGIYNNQDKTAFHQQWYTNAFLAMKGYALGMMERRYSNAHHSIALDNDVEGSLNTMSKLWFSSFSKEVNIAWYHALGATFLAPFLNKNNKLRQKLQAAGFSDFQVSNMKRNFMDMFILGLLYIMRLMCAEPPKEDRDDDYEPDQLSGLAYYFTTRWIREQEAFNAPWGIMTESTSLLSFVPIGGAALWDMGKFGYEIGGSMVGDVDNSDFFYQRDHPNEKYFEGDTKAWNHFLGMIPYVKSWYNIENPYEAIKSYEYGRKLSGR